MPDHSEFFKEFNPEEQLCLLEVAHQALGDADVFDELVQKMDIADEELADVRDRLYDYLSD
jgi:hypothetical protein